MKFTMMDWWHLRGLFFFHNQSSWHFLLSTGSKNSSFCEDLLSSELKFFVRLEKDFLESTCCDLINPRWWWSGMLSTLNLINFAVVFFLARTSFKSQNIVSQSISFVLIPNLTTWLAYDLLIIFKNTSF